MRRRHGFTLVELLVVIGIITVLISILLPVLSKAREQARNVQCQSNMRQILMATLEYATANRGRLPIPGDITLDQGSYFALQNTTPGMLDFNAGTLLPYVSPALEVRQRIFLCPDDGPNRPVGMNDPSDGGGTPDLSLPPRRNFSYCLNFRLMGLTRGALRLPDGRVVTLFAGIVLSRIRHTEHKLLVTEPEYPRWAWDDVAVGSGALPPAPQIVVTLSRRHGGQCNEGFADGHVERFDPGILQAISDPLANRRNQEWYTALDSRRDEND